MEGKHVFQCRLCGKTVEVMGENKAMPICCDEPMEEDLPVCLLSDTAEHSRFTDTDEPCDDGRAGK